MTQVTKMDRQHPKLQVPTLKFATYLDHYQPVYTTPLNYHQPVYTSHHLTKVTVQNQHYSPIQLQQQSSQHETRWRPIAHTCPMVTDGDSLLKLGKPGRTEDSCASGDSIAVSNSARIIRSLVIVRNGDKYICGVIVQWVTTGCKTTTMTMVSTHT